MGDTIHEEPLIIVVDDNPYDAEITLEAIKRHNGLLQTKVLKDGEEANCYFTSAGASESARPNPKFILLDLKLPRMHGFEVLRRLKADQQTKHIPVIILTSSSEDRDKLESKRLGANDYIVKPMDFTKFIQVVGELCHKWAEPEGHGWNQRHFEVNFPP